MAHGKTITKTDTGNLAIDLKSPTPGKIHPVLT
jgi:hypothetical protein